MNDVHTQEYIEDIRHYSNAHGVRKKKSPC